MTIRSESIHTRTMHHRTWLIASVLVALVITPAPDAEAATYSFPNGAVNATLRAAGDVLGDVSHTCSVSTNELTALLLSIPVHELSGGSSSSNPSLQYLSRWDGWNVRTGNPRLYSRETYSSEKRLHYSPASGYWQVDVYPGSEWFTHTDRMRGNTAGYLVGMNLMKKWCPSGSRRDSSLRSYLNAAWHGCSRDGVNDRCWNTFNDMYRSNGTLGVSKTSGNTWTGGLIYQSCRFGSSGSIFGCQFSDPESTAEGSIDAVDKTGAQARTPLADGFFAFKTSTKVYGAWLAGDNAYNVELVKEINPTNSSGQPNLEGGRDPGSRWYTPTSLMAQCYTSGCTWRSR